MSDTTYQQEPADEGRQVPPHRSGGQRRRVVSTGNLGLLLASVMAMSGGHFPVVARERFSELEPRPQTVRLGRRAEKDAAALAKAEAKRQRRAAKRGLEASK